MLKATFVVLGIILVLWGVMRLATGQPVTAPGMMTLGALVAFLGFLILIGSATT